MFIPIRDEVVRLKTTVIAAVSVSVICWAICRGESPKEQKVISAFVGLSATIIGAPPVFALWQTRIARIVEREGLQKYQALTTGQKWGQIIEGDLRKMGASPSQLNPCGDGGNCGCAEPTMQQAPHAPSGDDWGVAEAQSGGVQLFDWDLFRTRRDEFPHVGIAGKTGGGKSWLAEYLASCFDGVVVAIAPHWKKGGFTSADLVIGWGRNYGTVEDYANYSHLSFDEILSGEHNISACAFMVALHKEMDRRYQIDDDQNFVGDSAPEIVVILDEFNQWASTAGLKDYTFDLLREARKVKIRLIPLVQGTEVKAMGCEGEGQVRDQLTWVMISNKAKQYLNTRLSAAKKGTDDHDYWIAVSDFISVTKYPAFVGDLDPKIPALPATIPDLTQWKKTQPQKATLAGWGQQAQTAEPSRNGGCSSVATDETATEPAESCPHCGSYSIKWLSKNAGRKQCKDCNKTWSI